jgi:hypothetical protein
MKHVWTTVIENLKRGKAEEKLMPCSVKEEVGIKRVFLQPD